jgi:hypothetical protein
MDKIIIDEDGDELIELELTAGQYDRITSAAASAGMTLEQYVRARCGLYPRLVKPDAATVG